MRRRRNTRYAIGLFVIWLCFGVGGFLVGYYVSERTGEQPIQIVDEIPYIDHSNIGEDDLEEGNQPDDRQVTSLEVVISEDTKFIYRTRYEKCQNTLDKVVTLPNEIVGLNKREFNDYVVANLEGWRQVDFSSDQVVVFQNRDQFCPNHYWVSEVDGFIAIFKFDEAGNKELVEKTQIPISTLPSMDKENLKRGFPLPSREAVDQLLEDYSG